jgi:hypothetical protein
LEDFILQGLMVFVFSTVKFLAGIFTSLGLQQGLLPSYISTVGGGILGVFIFTFFGDWVSTWYYKIFPKKNKNNFSAWTRFIVKVRRNFGLPGIAMLTPLLSIPIGIFLSLSLTKDKWRISFFMFASFLIWATIIFVPYYLFDINIKELITSWLN